MQFEIVLGPAAANELRALKANTRAEVGRALSNSYGTSLLERARRELNDCVGVRNRTIAFVWAISVSFMTYARTPSRF